MAERKIKNRVVEICVDEDMHEWCEMVLPAGSTARDVLRKLESNHITVKGKAVASIEDVELEVSKLR